MYDKVEKQATRKAAGELVEYNIMQMNYVLYICHSLI